MHTTTSRIEAELLKLKDEALAATQRSDGAFYRGYLADDAIAVVPAGIFDKEKIVQAMSAGAGFRSKEINDEKAMVLGSDSGLVTYRATFEKPDGTSSAAFVSTLYRRIDGKWKGIFYQQTPLPTAGG